MPVCGLEVPLETEQQLALLAQKVRDVVARGLLVVIFGWMPKNHNDNTSCLSTKKIRFFERLPQDLPAKTGLVIATNFVRHKESERARSRFETHAIALKLGQLRKVLEAVADILQDESVSTDESPEDDEIFSESETCSAEDEEAMHELLEEILTKFSEFKYQPKEVGTMDENVQKFVEIFLLASKKHPSGMVSTQTLGKILKETQPGMTPYVLVNRGWIKPHKPPLVKKTGWYKAGPMMTGSTPEPSEPKNAFEAAERIIARKPALLARKDANLAENAEIDEELERISKFEEMLGTLAEMVKPS